MSKEKYDFQRKLGQGAFGQVYKVKHRRTQILYAMKIIQITPQTNSDLNKYRKEAQILIESNHENIIRIKEDFILEHQSQYCIVMELADNDLFSLIRTKKSENLTFSEKEIWEVFKGLARGLNCLHSQNIIHRDIKPANILLKNRKYKIGDMGISEENSGDYFHTIAGTPAYMAPEIHQEKPYSTKADIWSLGCVVYEMLTLANPSVYLFAKENKDFPYGCSFFLKKMIEKVLKVDYKFRPSAREILEEIESTKEKSNKIALEIIQYEEIEKEIGEDCRRVELQSNRENIRLVEEAKSITNTLSTSGTRYIKTRKVLVHGGSSIFRRNFDENIKCERVEYEARRDPVPWAQVNGWVRPPPLPNRP